jgi:hypothetical protein
MSCCVESQEYELDKPNHQQHLLFRYRKTTESQIAMVLSQNDSILSQNSSVVVPFYYCQIL